MTEFIKKYWDVGAILGTFLLGNAAMISYIEIYCNDMMTCIYPSLIVYDITCIISLIFGCVFVYRQLKVPDRNEWLWLFVPIHLFAILMSLFAYI